MPKRDEGMDPEKDYVSMRKETIAQIEEVLQENNFILIRSPPLTGKTSLCGLLEDHFKNEKENDLVVSLTCLDMENDFSVFWQQHTGYSWRELLERKEPTIIILDEVSIFEIDFFHFFQMLTIFVQKVQLLYEKSYEKLFWRKLKSQSSQKKREAFKHIKLIAFAAYGEDLDLRSTPFQFHDSFSAAEILFCKEAEFTEIIDDFNKRNPNSSNLQISESLKKHLQEMTRGHVGILQHTLQMIENIFKKTKKINEQELRQFLISGEYISGLKSNRAMLALKFLTDEEKSFLKNEIIPVDTIPIPDEETRESEICNNLMKKGVLTDTSNDKNCVGFSSPLLQQACFYRFFKSPKKALADPESLESFLLEILKKLKKSYLTKTVGLGSNQQILERTWQMEFYRIATSLLSKKTFLSVDVGKIFGTQGMADFYVHDHKRWLIELTREDDRLPAHANKIEPGGLKFECFF